jgi:hypothetical protein
MPAAVAANGEPPQDALTYVRAVKARFLRTDPQVYESFLEVMRDFKNARYVKSRAALGGVFCARIPPPLPRLPDALLTPRPARCAQIRHPGRRPKGQISPGRASRPSRRVQLLFAGGACPPNPSRPMPVGGFRTRDWARNANRLGERSRRARLAPPPARREPREAPSFAIRIPRSRPDRRRRDLTRPSRRAFTRLASTVFFSHR